MDPRPAVTKKKVVEQQQQQLVEEDEAVDDVPMTDLMEQIDVEEQQKDRALLDLVNQMEDYPPIIPDAVTEYYLNRSGLDCPDVRLRRLFALAAHKFIMDIIRDAYQYSKVRHQGMSSKEKRMAGKKAVLTMEDLSAALAEYNINTRRPEYYS